MNDDVDGSLALGGEEDRLDYRNGYSGGESDLQERERSILVNLRLGPCLHRWRWRGGEMRRHCRILHVEIVGTPCHWWQAQRFRYGCLW